MLVNSQLICLPPVDPVGILNLVMFIGIFISDSFVYFGPEKPQWEVANCVYNCLVKLKPMDMRRTFLWSFLACVAADFFPFSGGAEIEQANEKRASEGARLGWAKKLGRSREGVSKKGEGLGRKGTVRRLTPSPYCLFCHSSQFSSRSRAFGKGKETAATQARSFYRTPLVLTAMPLWQTMLGANQNAIKILFILTWSLTLILEAFF